MANFLLDKFDYYMNDLGDPRVRDWIGFSSPAHNFCIISLYLLSVYKILPRYMKNRQPYNLSTVLFYYNIFQITYCAYLIYGVVAVSGWMTNKSWLCERVDYSDKPNAVKQLHLYYYGYVLKAIEMIETAFFILRKKDSQVTKLHVYHHASTFFLGWFAVKYIAGGSATFPIMVNCSIHILMYTYYLLASLGPEWQKKLNKWKPRLTMCQMIQFCILIGHALNSLRPYCNLSSGLVILYIPNVVVIFYMFWDFYKKTYLKKQE